MHEGDLPVTLEGKTADLIREECAQRSMGTDALVRDIIWCWYTDLVKARGGATPKPIRHSATSLTRGRGGKFATRKNGARPDSPLPES